MANQKDEQQLGKQDPKAELDQGKQQPTGQQNQPSETGQQGQASSGQADPGQSGDTDTLSDERGSGQGADRGQSSGSQGGSGSFIGSQATGSSEELPDEAATAESDFASQGQGALNDQDEDIETGQPSSRDNDIEGGSGA